MSNRGSASVPTRVGLIGGGQISEQHLFALKNVKGVRLMGICDLSRSLATFTARRFGLESAFTDYREMLQTSRCDIVHVLTPPATHDKIVRDCMAAGCDVIVEKPVALSREAFHDLWSFSQERGRRLIENQNYRFNGPVRRLTELVESGAIGEVEEVEVRMQLPIRAGGRLADANAPHPSHRLPAGAIHEFITHLSYLLLEFMPVESMDDVEYVRAAWRNYGGGDFFKYDDLDAIVMSGAAHGRIRFSCRQQPDMFAIHVRGSAGHAEVELFQPAYRVIRQRSGGRHLDPMINGLANSWASARDGVGNLYRKVRNRNAYDGLRHFVEQTYASWRCDQPGPVGYPEMDNTVRLIDALLESENQL